ncbi:ribonuclease E inhibitor RraA/Dimethylmenaquinone methyltransferase [Suillus bovinus]|uniref:ribonuclease E inhibitor RraA/Dimethylmenaquinone methyltransferase n=1 Tax=Suillus bovinus TaxID=48563 RepID=UPI001B876BC5|nr:ribonuclease E inhibitor RraA/Dimethylmenaquinone methyltransferase [Suillus bovinus]KAG2153712.1 ribonuclease E inhibitor RraA/Dimethylmenaquinone methyltransferase [Suillus bovinus]
MIARTRLLATSRAMSTSTRSSACPLSQFSACEISDALIKLGSPNGGHIPDIHMLSPISQVKICAPAYTVQMVLASDNSAPKLSSHFVDTAPPGSVVVVNAPPQIKNAARGAVGVVISGRCRDLAEHRAADFPVFARGHSTVGQSPFVRPSGVNITLTIHPKDVGDGPDAFAPVTVTPGDWIVADEDGVVCVPVDMVDKVVELAQKGQDIDAKCMADIKAGKGIQASFKEHRGK